MKTIKIFLSIIIILAVLIFLVAPPLIGLWVKHHYTDEIDRINQNNPNITMTVAHYDFGWFSSKAIVHIDVHTLAKAKQQNIRVNTQVNIHHGPIAYIREANKRRILLALAEIKMRAPTLNLTGHSIWHFNNTLTSQFESPAFELTQNGMMISMNNFRGIANYNMGSRHWQAQFTIGSFSISNWIHLEKLFYSADINREDLVNYGKQKLTVDLLKINAGHQPITINNMTASSNTTLNSGNIDMSVNYAIQSVSQNELDLNSAQIDFSVRGVNAKSFNALLRALQVKQNQQQMNYQQIMASGMDLLRHGLMIQVNHIYLRTSDGTIKIDGKFTVPKLDKNTTLLQVPMMTKADFQIQAPKTWVKKQLTALLTNFPQTAQQYQQQDPSAAANDTIQQWESQNLLISSGDDYKARIQYMGGRLLINGQVPQPLYHQNDQQQHQPHPQNNLNSNQQGQLSRMNAQ